MKDNRNSDPKTALMQWKQNQAKQQAQAKVNTQSKAQHTAPNSTTAPKENKGVVVDAQNNAQARATKSKGKMKGVNPIIQYSAKMAQLSRQFDLADIATAYCKLNYPENYHFKQKFAKECDQIRADLKGGKHLLLKIIEQANIKLTAEELAQLNAFKLAVAYLNRKLKGSARYVELIDTTNPEDLPELVSRNDRKRETLTQHQEQQQSQAQAEN